MHPETLQAIQLAGDIHATGAAWDAAIATQRSHDWSNSWSPYVHSKWSTGYLAAGDTIGDIHRDPATGDYAPFDSNAHTPDNMAAGVLGTSTLAERVPPAALTPAQENFLDQLRPEAEDIAVADTDFGVVAGGLIGVIQRARLRTRQARNWVAIHRNTRQLEQAAWRAIRNPRIFSTLEAGRKNHRLVSDEPMLISPAARRRHNRTEREAAEADPNHIPLILRSSRRAQREERRLGRLNTRRDIRYRQLNESQTPEQQRAPLLHHRIGHRLRRRRGGSLVLGEEIDPATGVPTGDQIWARQPDVPERPVTSAIQSQIGRIGSRSALRISPATGDLELAPNIPYPEERRPFPPGHQHRDRRPITHRIVDAPRQAQETRRQRYLARRGEDPDVRWARPVRRRDMASLQERRQQLYADRRGLETALS